jgi:phosphoglycolate phosphatase
MPRGQLSHATVVFDLDGTLVDTAPDLANALNDVLTRRGHAPVPLGTIRSSVGLGARTMIDRSLRRANAHDDVDAMLADFLRHYEANIAAESRPFPGAVASLEALRSEGARLALCTNKREDLTRKLLAALEIERHFHGIAGRDTFAVAKPEPGHLTQVIALAGGAPSRAIMVGDSAVDIETARRANVPVIQVSFGYGSGPLHGLAPDAVIDHFDALAPLAARLLRPVLSPADRY